MKKSYVNVSRAFPIILLTWYGFSMFFGILFNSIIGGDSYIFNYISYLDLVENDLYFNSVTNAFFIFSPIAFFYFYRKGFLNISIEYFGFLILLSLFFIGFFVNSNLMRFDRANKFDRLLFFFIEKYDWFAASLICFIGFYISLIVLVILAKHIIYRRKLK